MSKEIQMTASLESTDKRCITCKKEGHTYLECPEVDILDILGACIGINPLPSGKTRSQVENDLKRLGFK